LTCSVPCSKSAAERLPSGVGIIASASASVIRWRSSGLSFVVSLRISAP
jgi:hypothetical protein